MKMKYIFLQFILLHLFNIGFSSTKDSLFFELKNKKSDKDLIDIYNKLSKAYKSSNTDSSFYFCEKAFMLSKKTNDKKGEADASYNYGTLLRNSFTIDSCLSWFENAFIKYSECKDTMEMSRTLTTIGNIYFNDKSDYTTALKYFKQSLAFKKKIDDKKGMGINLYNIGNSYRKINNLKFALDNYIKAKEVFTEVDFKSGLANSLNSMGNIYEDWGSYDLAIKSYKEALYLEESSDFYNNLGNVNVKIKQYDTAIFNFVKALEFAKITDRIQDQAKSLRNLGLIYNDLKNFKKSDEYLKEALLISEEIQLKDVESEILQAIGYGLLFQNKCKESLQYLLKSQEIATEIEYKDIMSSNYIFISESYMCLGDGANAKEYWRMHIESNENSNKELNDLRIRYETEKQEKEIQLLNKEKELTDAQLEAKIAESNMQRIIIIAAFVSIIIFIISTILIVKQYRQKRKANEKLAKQNKQIKEQNEEIEASINYALRIQKAVLPLEKEDIDIPIGDYFLIFKPKHIVAGDYFWTKQVNNSLIIAVADCTGHGVPGAFMSMLGVSFLNEIVRKTEITQANQVLIHLRLHIIEALKQKGRSGEQKDGMDMAICVIDTSTLKLQYAGANNPLYIIRKDMDTSHKTEKGSLSFIEEIKADKMPVAIYEKMEDYTNHYFDLHTGDKLYMFSDGFADQFGGPNGKKFMYKPFKRILIETKDLPVKDQGDILENKLKEWINHIDPYSGIEYEQTDDITVFGLEIKNRNI